MKKSEEKRIQTQCRWYESSHWKTIYSTRIPFLVYTLYTTHRSFHLMPWPLSPFPCAVCALSFCHILTNCCPIHLRGTTERKNVLLKIKIWYAFHFARCCFILKILVDFSGPDVFRIFHIPHKFLSSFSTEKYKKKSTELWQQH